MRVFVACLFIFFVAASATETSFMKTLQGDITALLQKGGATIESVLKLLQDLKAHEEADLKAMIEHWVKVEQVRFLRLIAEAQKALDDKKAECAIIDVVIEKQRKELTVYEENIKTAQLKIETNNKIIQQREEKRCKNNLLFLDKIRQATHVQKFLVYLVKEMSKSSFQTFVTSQPSAFLSLKEVAIHQHDNSIAELTKIHLMSTFFQAPTEGLTDQQLDKQFNVSARTSSEIGTGHVDNNRANLTLDTYNCTVENVTTFIKVTIDFMLKLVHETEANIKELRENEDAAVEAYEKFRATLDIQNHVLTLYIAHCTEFIGKIKIAIDNNVVVSKKCHAEIPPLEAELKLRTEVYEKALAAYTARKTKCEKLIPAIQKAIDLYTSKVASAKSTYHARVQDYAEDQKFDKTHSSYEARTDFEYKKL